MRSTRSIWLFAPVALLGCAKEADEPAEPANADSAARAALQALSFTEQPPLPPDPTNAWADSVEAARFGHRVFFDTSMSGELLTGDNDGSQHALGVRGETGKVSCAGCHLSESWYSDTRTIQQQVSLGTGWGLRRAPSLLDVGHTALLMWDGRKDSLFSQPMAVIESGVEMNSGRLYAAEMVFQNHRTEYESLFGAMPPLDDATRFPALGPKQVGCRILEGETKCKTVMRGAPGDGAEYDGMSPDDQHAVTQVIANVGKALGAYERLLTCGPSRFDQWMAGEAAALSDAEQRGAFLFVGKAQCNGCHSGPFLSDEKFHNVGLKPAVVATVFLDANDRGAGLGFSELQADALNSEGVYSDGSDGRVPTAVGPELEGAFRTPKLRCAKERPSFMHTAQLRKLSEVVSFFDRGGDIGGYPGTSEIAPLGLTADERSDLVAFLESLSGPGPDSELLTPPE
jgi:cytochrome c peroxidase